MNIHEYQAKQVLKGYGAPVADGAVVTSLDDAEGAVASLPGPVWVVKSQIHAKLMEIVHAQDGSLAASLNEPLWQDMTPYEYSFLIFQILRLDADFMQNVLELRTTNERLLSIYSLLTGNTR